MVLRKGAISSVTIHHTATPMSCSVADIDRMHRQRGFACVGYNYLIKFDTPTSSICSIKKGRDLQYKGAHCSAGNANNSSIGIAVIGDFTKNKLSSDQYRALAGAIVHIMRKHNIKKIYFHRDWMATLCPALDENLKKLVLDLL